MLTPAEKQQIQRLRADLKQLRELTAAIDTAAAAVCDQLLAIDDRLLDLVYPLGVESLEFKR